MDINSLTIAQVREIAAMFPAMFGAPIAVEAVALESLPAFDTGMIGKYVIVRCRDAGVHAGVLASTDGRACILTEARRLWFWKVKGSGDFLHAIAISGVHPDSKLSAPVERIALTENCEIIQCSADAEAVIRGQAVHNG